MSESPPAPSFERRARRFVLRRAPYYLGFYVVMVAFFMLMENWLVFRPVRDLRPVPDARFQDIYLTAADGTKLHAWWLPPTRPEAGAFLFAHGNGGNLSHRSGVAFSLNKLTDAGVLVFDYPGYGRSDGTPTESGCYAAGDAAYDWLNAGAKIPKNRIVIIGESLGSGVAVDLATRHEHRALVLMCPFTTLPAAAKSRFPFLPTHTFMRSRFDSLSKIGTCRRPLFVAHGTDDSTVPYWQGEELFAAANEPKEFLRLDGFHHALAGDHLYVPLAAFLDRHPAK